jgi:hypothetical protein
VHALNSLVTVLLEDHYLRVRSATIAEPDRYNRESPLHRTCHFSSTSASRKDAKEAFAVAQLA